MTRTNLVICTLLPKSTFTPTPMKLVPRSPRRGQKDITDFDLWKVHSSIGHSKTVEKRIETKNQLKFEWMKSSFRGLIFFWPNPRGIYKHTYSFISITIPHTIIYYITLTPTSSILSVQKEGNTPQISYGLDLGRIIYKKGREENTTGRERTAMCAEVSKHTPSWCFGG